MRRDIAAKRLLVELRKIDDIERLLGSTWYVVARVLVKTAGYGHVARYRSATWLRRYPVLYGPLRRSEEHTSELQSLMRISYAVLCLKKKKKEIPHTTHTTTY